MERLLSLIRRCAWCGLISGRQFGLCTSCESFWDNRFVGETYLPMITNIPVHRSLISKDQNSAERQLIVLLKGEEQKLLWKYFARKFLISRLISERRLPASPIIVSAPSSTGRNHAQIFAEEISRLTDWPHMDIFTQSNESQKKLKRSERLQKNIYLNRAHKLSERNIVFIDDMIVTGGTAVAAEEALPDVKSFEVWALMHQLLLH